MHDLAILGRFDDAEPLYRRSIELRRATLGPKHREAGGEPEQAAAYRQELQDLADGAPP